MVGRGDSRPPRSGTRRSSDHTALERPVSIDGAGTAQAAKDATAAIPIVFGASNDPVKAGLASSLARPAGTSPVLSPTARPWPPSGWKLLEGAVPTAGDVGVLADPGSLTVDRDWDETRVAAQALGLDPRRHEARRPEDFESTFSALGGEGAEALTVLAV